MPGGLVTGKPAAVVYARGGAYVGEGSGMDHQKPYVEQILGFFGFTTIHPIVIESTFLVVEVWEVNYASYD